MRTNAIRFVPRSGLFAALVLVALGCGQPERGDVGGKVTYKGRPVIYGAVSFLGSDGKMASGAIQVDGSYMAPNVLLGEHRVGVWSPNPKESYDPPSDMPPDVVANIKKWFPLPRGADAPRKTGLTYNVKPGSNTFDIAVPDIKP